jgi:hypothetical protein
MDKREFYKELMKEYTFDSAKVRRFAKRASTRGVRVSVKRWWHIPSTVAVAAASLAVGVFSLFYNGGDVSVIDTPVINTVPPVTVTTSVNDDESRERAENAKLSYENQTLYLSFNGGITFRELENKLLAISDTGNIVIETVYVMNEDNSEGEHEPVALDEFEEIKNDDSIKIVGAKVSTPGRLIEEIERQTEIEQVMLVVKEEKPSGGENNNENDNHEPKAEVFIPINVHPLPDRNHLPSVTVAEPVYDDEPVATTEKSGGTQTPPNPSAPAVEKLVSIDVPGVISADFISDKSFTAITADKVSLYEIADSPDSASELEINTLSEFVMNNYRTRFSTTGKSMLVSGCGEDGRRTVLLLADGEAQTLESLDISELTATGEIIFAFYDDLNRRIVMRIKENELNSIYFMDRDTFEITKASIEPQNNLVILALDGDLMFYAVKGVDDATLYRYKIAGGVSNKMMTFDKFVSFERNVSMSGFTVNSEGFSQIFTVAGGISEPLETEKGLVYNGNSTKFLTDGENFYILSENNVIEIFDGQATSGSRFGSSDLFSVSEITEKNVRIRPKN